MNSVFHAGELAVQAQAGVQSMAQRVGNSIHAAIPPTAAAFLEQQPFVIIASTAENGAVWASIIVDAPGFARVLDSQTVQIDAAPLSHDPLTANLQEQAPVGLLAIEFASRRRMRLNGVATPLADSGFQVRTQEVYANCPKYIQARSPLPQGTAAQSARLVQTTPALTAEQQQWIRTADTFFIASANPTGGADASHRGGNPGFVTVVDETHLLWPDYAGNLMFNTLGNLAINPQAGLLFLDFVQGRVLQLTGRTAIIWDEAAVAQYQGAERLVSFEVTQAIESADVLPFPWSFGGYSPVNP